MLALAAWAIHEITSLREGTSRQLSRSEMESELRFGLPPSARDFRWRNVEPGAFDDHAVLSFSVSGADLGAVMKDLPCTPSPSGSLKNWAELEKPPPTTGEMVCTQFANDQRWSAVRISPAESGRFTVSVERYLGY